MAQQLSQHSDHICWDWFCRIYVRRNSDGARYRSCELQGLSETEARIAAIKAQKERDRESALALKEMQLKQAVEDNREDSRRREEERQSAGPRKNAIAFDIDLSGDGVISKSSPHGYNVCIAV